jgi:hypothetical protein
LVLDNLSDDEANSIAHHLNDREGDYGHLFYKAVPDDYILRRWEP